jgi:hypothetical protein
MKHKRELCGELRKAKIEIWSCEVGFERGPNRDKMIE